MPFGNNFALQMEIVRLYDPVQWSEKSEQRSLFKVIFLKVERFRFNNRYLNKKNNIKTHIPYLPINSLTMSHISLLYVIDVLLQL